MAPSVLSIPVKDQVCQGEEVSQAAVARATESVEEEEEDVCAICYDSLSDSGGKEVIQLTTCGHRWHLECIQQQLEHVKPSPAQRLVLTGYRCALCGSTCDHPALRHMTRKTDSLQEKVDAVLKEQLQVQTEAELEEARRKYAIYLCSHCEEPYFGGTVDCADTADGEVPPEERLCVACAPTRLQQAHCRHPLQHRAYHLWKCRYCCKVASHVCYGTVHFCQDCHDRNSERVARRRQQGGPNNNEPPSCLTAISCPGGDACPYPRPPGVTHHQNGRAAECEQVYSCGLCQSNPTADHAFQEPPGSRNFLRNSSGQYGNTRGWQQMNFRSSWRVEDSDPPLSSTTTTNFVSNFEWCVMAQSVPVWRFVRDPSQVRLEASVKYMGRTDCPSVLRLELIVLNRQRRPIARQESGTLSAPADFWERASLTVEPTPGAHEVVLVIHGKDQRFWQGYYGSKVTDCRVRVLGDADELERVLLPAGAQQDVARTAGGETTMAND